MRGECQISGIVNAAMIISGHAKVTISPPLSIIIIISPISDNTKWRTTFCY